MNDYILYIQKFLAWLETKIMTLMYNNNMFIYLTSVH